LLLSIDAILGEMQDSLAAAVCYKLCVMGEMTTHLATWLKIEQKRKFNALARNHGVSSSALLRRLVDVALQGAAPFDSSTNAEGLPESRSRRLYVRITDVDRRQLSMRAADRGMRTATYASVLIQAHLKDMAPLPREELLALKRVISELSSIGRNLNQIAAASNKGMPSPGFRREDLKAFLDVCSALRDNTKSLLTANLRSWAIGKAHAGR
jgi:hypothetical protein